MFLKHKNHKQFYWTIGKSVCMKGCICFEKSLSCTDLCPCQAGDLRRNENTHLAISRNTDEDDDIWSHFFFFFIQSPSIGQSSKFLSVVRWPHRVEVWPNMHPSVSLTLPLIWNWVISGLITYPAGLVVY
jgi:hypothetical protein